MSPETALLVAVAALLLLHCHGASDGAAGAQLPRACTHALCFNRTLCEEKNYTIWFGRSAFFSLVHFDLIHGNGPEQHPERIPYATSWAASGCVFLYRAATQLARRDESLEPFDRTWDMLQPPGMNHMLIDIQDENVWADGLMRRTGAAMLVKSHASAPAFRPDFDISFPLYPRTASPVLAPGGARKYLATFKGAYYEPFTPGGLRLLLRPLHDPARGVVVAGECKGAVERPDWRWLNGDVCRASREAFDAHDYQDLMDSTFALAPAGRQPTSYRILEAMRSGVIPVVVSDAADAYRLPFDGVVCWQRCAVHAAVPLADVRPADYAAGAAPLPWAARLLDTLQGMPPPEVEARQRACLRMYDRFFNSTTSVFLALRASLMVAAHGNFDPCAADVDLLAPNTAHLAVERVQRKRLRGARLAGP